MHMSICGGLSVHLMFQVFKEVEQTNLIRYSCFDVKHMRIGLILVAANKNASSGAHEFGLTLQLMWYLHNSLICGRPCLNALAPHRRKTLAPSGKSDHLWRPPLAVSVFNVRT